ncbi:MAG: cysteine--tRNA ligase [Bacilli bacterium]
MKINLYNSLTNKVEEFKTIKPGEVSMYVCGPTVYSDPHIGNMRPVVLFDTLNRFFTYVGYKVKFVSNFTNVDDKIINKAIKENVSEEVISERYTKDYMDCLDALNILPAYKRPKVTEYMDDIIKYIANLVNINAAYVVDGDVFFDVMKVKDYGCLSKIKIDDLISGARVELNDKKHNPLDFALWKKTENGIKWHTDWCEGRPGWHTECCVMIDSIFGGVIDIHGGGLDLKFPHHENEIAQAMATHNNKIAHYWIHNGMMNINSEKMSKSLGNVIKAKDGINLYGADTIRLLLLNCQYRNTLNFTDDAVRDTNAILDKLNNCYKQLNLKLALEGVKLEGKSDLINPFLESMSDDINLPNAITNLLDMIKLANSELRNKDCSLDKLKEYFYALSGMIYVLGLHINVRIYTSDEISLYKEYLDSKKSKDFVKSDELRKVLIEKEVL